ncbi:MAG: DUF3795 domain-containing protein [Anaerolineae bacterium]
MMAACGLECSTCTLRTYPEDPAAANEILAWFHRQGWLKEGEGLEQALARKMVCTGCHGSRETHWSADCWILQCAVDRRGLDNCSQCPEFACQRLLAWSTGNEGYAAALGRLRGLAAAG